MDTELGHFIKLKEFEINSNNISYVKWNLEGGGHIIRFSNTGALTVSSEEDKIALEHYFGRNYTEVLGDTLNG